MMKISIRVFVLILGLLGTIAQARVVVHGEQAAAAPASAAQTSKVWVNLSSKVYHCPGTRYYGNTARGEYLSEADAESRGFRAAYGKRCGAASASSAKPDISKSAPLALKGGGERSAPASDPTVWVNTGSKVYHCAGTRYYGATKRGTYMKQSEADRSGNRPAGGKSCG